MLDLVFTTPDDGVFTIGCDVTDASARVAPVGSFVLVLLGVGAAALLGLGSLVTGAVWFTRRT